MALPPLQLASLLAPSADYRAGPLLPSAPSAGSSGTSVTKVPGAGTGSEVPGA